MNTLTTNQKTSSLTSNLWKESFRTAIKDAKALETFLQVPLATTTYPVFIPLKLAVKIKEAGPTSALWKQFVPAESENQTHGYQDPIGDQVHFKSAQLIHRYDNRVLFMPTSVCPVVCRYCFRKNELYNDEQLFQAEFEKTLNYLKNHPEINELIFSGGDPLILSDEKIDFYLEKFSQIPHLKFIRFHTRTPLIMPERLTDELIYLLNYYQKKFTKIVFVIHANHADEIDTDVKTGLIKLTQNGFDVLSQTVLLKNINDHAERLLELFLKLIDLQVRPYYLHHPDIARGAMHFYLSLEEGRKIYAALRTKLPGWAIPHYVIDLPEGRGKVSAFNPESFSFSGKLMTKDLEIIDYPL